MWSIVILPALIALTSDIQQDLYTFQAKLKDYHLSWVRESYEVFTGFYRNNRLYYVLGHIRGYPHSAAACKNREAKLWRLKKQDDLEYLYGQVLDIHSEAEGIWVYTQYFDDKRDNGSIKIIGEGYIVDEDQIVLSGYTDTGDTIDKVAPYPKNKCTAIV